MWPGPTPLARLLLSRGFAPAVVIIPLAGCGSSTAVNEIPEQSRKAIIQRKVDAVPGKARSSTTGAPTKGRAQPR